MHTWSLPLCKTHAASDSLGFVSLKPIFRLPRMRDLCHSVTSRPPCVFSIQFACTHLLCKQDQNFLVASLLGTRTEFAVMSSMRNWRINQICSPFWSGWARVRSVTMRAARACGDILCPSGRPWARRWRPRAECAAALKTCTPSPEHSWRSVARAPHIAWLLQSETWRGTGNL